MQQIDLVNRLDTFFSIEAYDEAQSWRPAFSDGALRTLQGFAIPSFFDGPWNGLMLDNTKRVEQVYLAIYPSQGVLDTIIAKEVASGAPGALIFAHYPVDYEANGRGCIPIPTEQLEELKEHSISYYTCHAPLDCHPELSTAIALANQLGLREQTRFAPYFGGMSAVTGVVGKEISFQAFAARLAKVCEVDRLRFDQVRHDGLPVHRVAVVPGNGADAELIEEATRLNCDTYVTGTWWRFQDSESAKAQRAETLRYLGGLRMNLLGVSPYATEMPVMRDQMPGWFRDQGLDVDFIPQDDPWR